MKTSPTCGRAVSFYQLSNVQETDLRFYFIFDRTRLILTWLLQACIHPFQKHWSHLKGLKVGCKVFEMGDQMISRPRSSFQA